MKKTLGGLAIGLMFLFGVTLPRPGITAQTNQGSAKPAGEKTAGESYKNIQALTDLKDAPASEFISAMQFISGSLSVSCDYCHAGPFSSWDKDVKPTKLMARNMIKMTRAINENNFGGHQVVTCNTCHQGSPHPKAMPTPWYKTPEQIAEYNKSVQAADSAAGHPAPTAEPAAASPEVDQVLSNYRKAVGITGLKSVRMSGVNEVGARGAIPFELYALLPDKVLIRRTNQGTETQQILNQDHGWILTPQNRTALSPTQIVGLKNLMGWLLPVRYEKSETQRKVTGVEKIGDRAYYVVEAHSGHPGKALERSYFDAQTGLLYKIRTELGTQLGVRVEETTFEDYRDINGVKLAFLITNHYMEDQFLYKISEIQVNLDVDPAKFEPPDPKERKGDH